MTCSIRKYTKLRAKMKRADSTWMLIVREKVTKNANSTPLKKNSPSNYASQFTTISLEEIMTIFPRICRKKRGSKLKSCKRRNDLYLPWTKSIKFIKKWKKARNKVNPLWKKPCLLLNSNKTIETQIVLCISRRLSWTLNIKRTLSTWRIV